MEICIKWKMCRTCTGDRIAQLQPIFKDTSIAQQLEEYAGILVKPDDGLPDKICLDCIETLQSVHAFLTCCRRSDAHLRNVVRRTMASGKCFPSSSMDQSVFSCSLSKLAAQHPRKRKQNKNARILEQKKKLKSEEGKNLFTEKEISNPDAIKAHEQSDVESNNSPGKGDSLPDSIKCEKSTEINKSSTTPTNNNEDCLLVSNLTESEIDTDSEDNEYTINNEDYENEYTEPDYSVAVAAAKESLLQISTQSVNTQTDSEEKPVLKVEEPTSTDTSMTMVDLAAACEPSSFPRHSCAICGNSFPNHAQLKSHLRTHRNEKNYECELCSKRFNAACNLTTHMRTHTGEKPFACSHCGRRFADRSTHRKHERMHTNERPYACNLCPKTFSLSTTLKAHFLSHSKEKPHKCVTCNKGFRLPHQLKAHERTHVHRYEVGITLYNQDEGDNSSS